MTTLDSSVPDSTWSGDYISYAVGDSRLCFRDRTDGGGDFDIGSCLSHNNACGWPENPCSGSNHWPENFRLWTR